MREYFMESKRIGFGKWNKNDIGLANLLWGDKNVSKYICASGYFSPHEIVNRLKTEVKNDGNFEVQYWHLFDLMTNEFIGCCGLRPCQDIKNSYELGIHLREKYWGKGLAKEASLTVITYAFVTLKAKIIIAGHHPQNVNSKNLLMKLGFNFIGNKYYQPTGLCHPSYQLLAKAK